MPGEILLGRDGDIATVTLSNPDRLNALDLGMWKGLAGTMRGIDRDRTLRCAVLRGAGDKAFAAGADIAEFRKTRKDSRSAKKYGEAIEAAMASVRDCRHPTVAMIRGACIGGGLEIASQCDLRICGTSSRFGVPIGKLGLVVGYGEMAGLVDLVGRAAAMEILLEGRILSSAEAKDMGLVNRVVEDDRVEEEAIASARRIAEGAPLVARWHKRFARRLANPRALTAKERNEAYSCFDTGDFREGVAAFLAKRKPEFRGK